MTFFANAAVAVTVDMEQVGTGNLSSSYFDFTWVVSSLNPALLEIFTLRPEKFGAMGNRYEVFSTDNQPIATIQDHKYALFDTSLTCDFEEGHLQINETTKSELLGIVNFGMSREFTVQGSAQGTIQVQDVFGSYQFDLQFTHGYPNVARLNTILAASLILLTRAIAERHRR